MELDRHLIERKDFAAARRGYAPEEVDAHLREISDAVAELKQAQKSSTSLAGTAADQVRTIVAASEASAVAIQEKAEAEAKRITDDAARRARETRDKADLEATTHVERVSEATQKMLERAQSIDNELDTLIDSMRSGTTSLVDQLRGGAGSLQSELESIRRGLSDVRDARPEFDPALDLEEPPDKEASLGGLAPAGDGALADEVTAGDEVVTADDIEAPDEFGPTAVDEPVADTGYGAPSDLAEPAPSEVETYDEVEEDYGPELDTGVEAEVEAEPEPARPAATGSSSGSEGARLIALNMALNGTPREETAQYLSDNFDLEDQDQILDEVYARVG